MRAQLYINVLAKSLLESTINIYDSYWSPPLIPTYFIPQPLSK